MWVDGGCGMGEKRMWFVGVWVDVGFARIGGGGWQH